MANHRGCKCGSGGHPRRCKVHTEAYQAHVDELNMFSAIPDGLNKEDEEYLERAMERYIISNKKMWKLSL